MPSEGTQSPRPCGRLALKKGGRFPPSLFEEKAALEAEEAAGLMTLLASTLP